MPPQEKSQWRATTRTAPTSAHPNNSAPRAHHQKNAETPTRSAGRDRSRRRRRGPRPAPANSTQAGALVHGAATGLIEGKRTRQQWEHGDRIEYRQRMAGADYDEHRALDGSRAASSMTPSPAIARAPVGQRPRIDRFVMRRRFRGDARRRLSERRSTSPATSLARTVRRRRCRTRRQPTTRRIRVSNRAQLAPKFPEIIHLRSVCIKQGLGGAPPGPPRIPPRQARETRECWRR